MLTAGGSHVVERRDSIDFWRGFVLCTIFVNHVPGNLFERWTYRNFGFSDSAEAFVFISGLSLALAYTQRFADGGQGRVLTKLLVRAIRLYGVHIALSVAGLAIFAAGASLANDLALMQVHGRDLFVSNPFAGVIGVLSLGHQLGYFNILPVYVLLVAMVPAMLWLANISRALMLAVSFTLYLLCRVSGFNLPNWPVPGTWFFDPLAWQFLMAIGVAVGSRLRQGPLPRNHALVAVSCLAMLIALLSVTDAFSLRPGLWDWMRGWADLDKTVLGAGRLLHFLALAYLVHVSGLGAAMRHSFWYKPLCTIGRHGLWAFAILSLLAAAAQVIAAASGHSAAIDAALIGSGLAILYGSTAALDAGRRRVAATPRTVACPVEPLMPRAAVAPH